MSEFPSLRRRIHSGPGAMASGNAGRASDRRSRLRGGPSGDKM